MPMIGQASGGFTESSSALRLLHVGVRNTVCALTPDGFTQTNPPIVTAAGTISLAVGMKPTTRGILSGSVAFMRPDVGSNYVGGPVTVAVSGITALQAEMVRPVGVFINTAVGNAYENIPAAASGKAPYVSSLGCYGNSLYETQILAAVAGGAQGDTIRYMVGNVLIASCNGYLMPRRTLNTAAAALVTMDIADFSLEVTNGVNLPVDGATLPMSTPLGILKVVADTALPEMIYDQRV